MVQLMWLIDRWQGDHTGNSNPANITINSDTDVTAIFINREYSLSVNTDGEGSVRERVVPAKTTDYPHGTTVEVTANPSEGWEFEIGRAHVATPVTWQARKQSSARKKKYRADTV